MFAKHILIDYVKAKYNTQQLTHGIKNLFYV